MSKRSQKLANKLYDLVRQKYEAIDVVQEISRRVDATADQLRKAAPRLATFHDPGVLAFAAGADVTRRS